MSAWQPDQPRPRSSLAPLFPRRLSPSSLSFRSLAPCVSAPLLPGFSFLVFQPFLVAGSESRFVAPCITHFVGRLVQCFFIQRVVKRRTVFRHLRVAITVALAGLWQVAFGDCQYRFHFHHYLQRSRARKIAPRPPVSGPAA